MKKLIIPLTILCLVMVFAAVPTFAHTQDEPFVTDLTAGGGNPASAMPVGFVRVWNDCENLYVQFDTNSSEECMVVTHVHVADAFDGIPQTKNGNPIPGQFEWSEPHGCVLEKTYTIPLDWDTGTTLVIAAHAALGQEEAMTIVSNVEDTVYGPINSDSEPIEWGDPGSAVRAYNWIGYTRNLEDPDQIPDCTTNPYSSLSWSWGFGLNPTYNPDIPGVLWISTATNTEEWHVDSWRKFVKSYEVPGYPIAGSLQVNADNYYVVSNGETIGSDNNIFNGPETYTFYPVEGLNTLEFITENWAQGSPTNYCDQVGNPNGLTYKADISYYADGETAWGGDYWGDPLEFPGKNWAIYFEYTVQTCTVRYPETGNVYIGYEDWSNGDFDYNDFGMTFSVEEIYARISGVDYLTEVNMTFTAVVYDSGMDHLIHIGKPFNGDYTYTVTRSVPAYPNVLTLWDGATGQETPADTYTGSDILDVTLFNTSKYTWPQKQIGETVVVDVVLASPELNPKVTLSPPRSYDVGGGTFYDMDPIMANYDPWEEGTLYQCRFHIEDTQVISNTGSQGYTPEIIPVGTKVPFILVVPYTEWIPPHEDTTITGPYQYFDDFYTTSLHDDWYLPTMVRSGRNVVTYGGLSWGPYPSP